MKRTSRLIVPIALLAAVGVFVQSASAERKGVSARKPKNYKNGAECSPGANAHCLCRGNPCSCGCGRACGPVRRAFWGAMSATQSGQPLCDPWARADWTAAQRAANSSWHAGYYHTGYGAPVALMVSPTVRMHTRWSWGVAQSTMHPLYHQYERPYPGPVAGGTGDAGTPATLPLMPTPRWPSHTDQFGVYYVRGPW